MKFIILVRHKVRYFLQFQRRLGKYMYKIKLTKKFETFCWFVLWDQFELCNSMRDIKSHVSI